MPLHLATSSSLMTRQASECPERGDQILRALAQIGRLHGVSIAPSSAPISRRAGSAIIAIVWRLESDLVQRLYDRARADRWQVSTGAFASFLLVSAQRAFEGHEPDEGRLERYFASLHLEDLALACACAEGVEHAWDAFVVHYRPVLYRSADALDPSGGAREVADSLYAELFGLRSRDGKRQSHLRYFHGRSSLATWLRAVLSQRYVDRRRLASRLDPLPDDDGADAFMAKGSSSPTGMLRFISLLQRVIAAAVAALPPRDRLRLRCYYAQDMTLAQIGKALAEHEATVSRNLARTRRTIRQHVERTLRDDERMTEDEIAECFSAAVEDSGPLDLAELLGPEPIGVEERKEVRQDRSK
jgi:RNA polymerase sigma-70 factor, ECF subfamily